MSEFFRPAQRALQDGYGSRPLADRAHDKLVNTSIDEQTAAFIEGCDFFYLATVDDTGRPTVSYKGGAPGFVWVVDEKTLLFPSYDGNGMFLSMGNIQASPEIGMLFMDFEHPHRLRVQAKAHLLYDEDVLSFYPGADLVVKAEVSETFINCPRYVHQYKRVASSRYTPDTEGHAPIPGWKRLDVVQDVLKPEDVEAVKKAGGTITEERLIEMLQAGDI